MIMDNMYKMTPDVPLYYRRLHPDAIVPERATEFSLSYDLHACIDTTDETPNGSINIHPGASAIVYTGLAIKIPKNHVGLICSRNELVFKHGINVLNNSVINSDFYGDSAAYEWRVVLHNASRVKHTIVHGDKIAQFVVVPSPRTSMVADDVRQAEEENRYATFFNLKKEVDAQLFKMGIEPILCDTFCCGTPIVNKTKQTKNYSR